MEKFYIIHVLYWREGGMLENFTSAPSILYMPWNKVNEMLVINWSHPIFLSVHFLAAVELT